MQFYVDQDKLLNLIIYISKKFPSFDIYFLLKTIYFADKKESIYLRSI
jgi:hypothetical protein